MTMQSKKNKDVLLVFGGIIGVLLLLFKSFLLQNPEYIENQQIIKNLARKPTETSKNVEQSTPQQKNIQNNLITAQNTEKLNNIKQYNTKQICYIALNTSTNKWEDNFIYKDEVNEAVRRGLTIEDCQNYLEEPKKQLEIFVSYSAKICNAKSNITNIRNIAGASGSKIIFRASNNYNITVIGETQSPTSGHKWFQIKLNNGEIGYVDHEFVTAGNCNLPEQKKQEVSNAAVSVRFARDGEGAVSVRIVQSPEKAVRARLAQPGQGAVSIRLAREGEDAVNIWFAPP